MRGTNNKGIQLKKSIVCDGEKGHLRNNRVYWIKILRDFKRFFYFEKSCGIQSRLFVT